MVNRPAAGEGSTAVELTATVRRNDAFTTRTFIAKVPQLPVTEAKSGYLFSYFTGEEPPTASRSTSG